MLVLKRLKFIDNGFSWILDILSNKYFLDLIGDFIFEQTNTYENACNVIKLKTLYCFFNSKLKMKMSQKISYL